MERQRVKVWDLPTRLVHWTLAILVCAALITGQIGGGAIDWHRRIGLALVGLVVFRLLWGFVGSRQARFASFWPTPATIVAHLRGEWRGLGHNPLGALSVLALLLSIAVQLATGLFANDDIAFRGPLADMVGKALSDRLSAIHRLTSTLLIVLVVLHLGAIAFYAYVKKDNLLKPMITGCKDVAPQLAHDGQGERGGGAIALVAALLIALAAIYGTSGVWLPKPPVAAQPAADW